MSFGPTQVDSNGIPIGSVIVPGNTTPMALKGGKLFTDSQGNQLAAAVFTLEDGSKATYSYARSTFAPAATPTDIAILNGSASKTVRVLRVEIWALTTAATAPCLEVQLIKRSTANTGGTSTGSPTGVPHDSLNSAATALMLCYTANPATLGTSLGIIRDAKLQPALSPSTATDFPTLEPLVWDFGTRPGQAITLHGVIEGLAINLVGATLPAGLTVGISLETTEE